MGLFDFLSSKRVNKDIEKFEKRRENSSKVKHFKEKHSVITVGENDTVEDLIAKVDEGEKQKIGEAVIHMIKITIGLIKPKLYTKFVNRLKTQRPNLYSKYLDELGVNDFGVSFNNHLKKLLPSKTENKLLFFLFFPFKLTWMVFKAPFGDTDDSDGKKVAEFVMFIIWLAIIGIVVNLTG